MRSFSRRGILAGAVALVLLLGPKAHGEEIPREYRETVKRGLEYLAKSQFKDGHWESINGQYAVSMTALGGMALLCEGSTIREGKYRDNIRRAANWLMDRGAPVGAVGLLGAEFDRRSGRLLRPTDEELTGPVTVDYIAGGQMLMTRVAAVRAVGAFDPKLFFAFDDLDYCLRLRRGGFAIYAYGPIWLESRRRALDGLVPRQNADHWPTAPGPARFQPTSGNLLCI